MHDFRPNKSLAGLLVAAPLAALIAAPQASAADFPAKAAPSPVYSWSGCYVGAQGGGGWSRDGWDSSWLSGLGLANLGTDRAAGWIAGGQAGCDYQIGNLVFGIVAELDSAGLRGQGGATLPSTLSTGGVLSSRVNALATGTVRIGYAFDRALPYIKGGLAWAHDGRQEFDALNSSTGALIPVSQGNGGSVLGWTIGAGVEVAFAQNWSWKVEYDYIDVGTNGMTLALCTLATSGPGCGGSTMSGPFDIKQTIQTVAIGVNYRFH